MMIAFEVCSNCRGYRLYVKVQYFPFWRNFANPIYLLLLLGLCLFLYVMIQLRKSYEVWYTPDYAQNLQLQISEGYQPAKLHESSL
ncbi:MAG: hypothetical protein U1E92_00080 [Moraxella osloensis]